MGYQKKSYKKFVATAATATLVATAIVPVAAAATGYSDVAENNEFKPFIDALSEQGIIKGYTSDNTFRPYNKVTRGQVTLMLGRWLESKGETVPADWATNPRFSDVPASNEELAKYAALVKDAGVFDGVNGELLPYQNITREHMAAVLDRVAETVAGVSLVELAEEVDDEEVTDMDTANAEYRDAIQALVDLEISTVSNFRPKEDLTRAQFAKFLYNTMDIIEEVTVAPSAPTAEELLSQLKDIENTLPAIENITADNVEEMKAIADQAAADIDAIKTLIEEGDYSEEEIAKLDQMIRDVFVKLDGVFLKIEEVTAEAPTAEELLSQLKDIENTLPAVEKITADNVEEMKAIADKAFADINAIKEIIAQGEYSEEEIAKLDQMIRDVFVKLDGVFLKIEEVTAEAPVAPTAEELLSQLKDIENTLPAIEKITADNAKDVKAIAEKAEADMAAVKEVVVSGEYTPEEVEKLHKALNDVSFKLNEVLKKVEEVTAPTPSTVEELLAQMKSIEDKMPAIENITAENAADVKALAEQAEADLAKVKEVVVAGEYTEEEAAKLHKALDDVANKINGVLEKVEEVIASTPSISPEVETMLDGVESIIKDLPKKEEINAGNADQMKEKADQAAAQLKELQEKINQGQYTPEEKAALENAVDELETAIKDVEKWIEEVTASTPSISPEVESMLDGVGSILKGLPKEEEINAGNADQMKEKADQAAAQLKELQEKINQGQYTPEEKAALENAMAELEAAIEDVNKWIKEAIEAAKPVIKNVTSVTNNTVTIEFNVELDEKTASDTNNYKIENLNILSAKPSITDEGTQIVTLTIGENKKTGSHEIKVSGVKSKTGVEMDVFNDKVDLIENIQPTVVSAEYVSFGTIEVTFSENVKAAGLEDNDDFVLHVGPLALPYDRVECEDGTNKAYIKLLPEEFTPVLPLSHHDIDFDDVVDKLVNGLVKLDVLVGGKSPITDEAGNKIKPGNVDVTIDLSIDDWK